MTSDEKGLFDAPDLLSLIDRALAEDLGAGDVTTTWTVPADVRATGRLMAKRPGVIAGLEVVRLVFQRIDPRLQLRVSIQDGDRVEPGQRFADISGPVGGILTGERTALNFLQHLSGIATLTARYVSAVAGTPAQITDTRKTIPGLRQLEKYAVRMGGGMNHRLGLFDMVLIKDNHIAAAGGITPAVERCRERMHAQSSMLKIEVETETLTQVEEAARLMVDRIMLDNMSLDAMRAAVALVRRMTAPGRPIELEASGALTLDRVRAVAETGVDLISIGALTHSAPALDISLEMTG
ncbi:MAG: carboxylating nicotinate-nucleotide diphosphorylase [Candidatus Latescibacteria bacterium]|nr:carboxylating nicotinate-nucleotide diphosphorylase [Candidatus Latescibacterota bacterium]